jgi:SRSO17 transposase
MDSERNFANIGRTLHDEDGQSLQHFMTHSPWSVRSVYRQIQAEIARTPALVRGGVLILDETADEKAGRHNAGASRQYNGRLGKVDVGRVDTVLGYCQPAARLWTLVDAEVFLPEEWFGPERAEERRELGVPSERKFQTKPELGWEMIERARANGLPFEPVCCDGVYGRKQELRAALEARQIGYAAEVPSDTQVYRKPPRCPEGAEWGLGPARKRWEIRELGRHRGTRWERRRVRCAERGWLEVESAVLRVWTEYGETVRAEWLVIRREANGKCRYTLLNGSEETPASRLVERSGWRYYVERLIEDGKSELGWDEFRAQKYRATEHHLALTALATWFVAQTKLEWGEQHLRDAQLAAELEVAVLPALSTANVRELLKAGLPLPELTRERARALVVEHLVKRSVSMRSRLRKQRAKGSSP